MANKSKKDPRVDAYIAAAKPFAKPILKRLRKIVHEVCPQATEDIKWRMPWILVEGKLLCAIPAFKAHSVLAFWNDGMHRLNDKRHPHFAVLKKLRRIESIDNLPTDAVLKKLVKNALNVQASKPKPKPKLKKKVPKNSVTKKKVAKKKATRKSIAKRRSI
ncbi:hypothetical protein BH10BDE1_BH10BDE1_05000 [soil metagenome]